MFKIKFNNIILISNKTKVTNSKVVLFFYGLGCSSNDLKFLFKRVKFKSQLLIVELPGHNHVKSNNYDLMIFARNMYLFLKKNKINEITFFAHSLGGIIPILLVKYFLKKKYFIKNFINYEGNLTKYDTANLTKKTVSYNKKEFIYEKFKQLINKCRHSDQQYLNSWSKSLLKTSSTAFYDLSKQCVKLSESNELLYFFRIFFKKKIYLSGVNTHYNLSENLFGSIRYKIKESGHFSFFENKLEFSKIFNQLILKKT